MTGQPASPLRRRDIVVAVSCGLFVAGMVGAAYAAVPFYDWFCRTTGFNGTTQVAISGPSGMIDRTVTVRSIVPLGAEVVTCVVPLKPVARQNQL